MNNARPIKDDRILSTLLEYFKKKSESNYLITMLALNTGLRISDILGLRVDDVKDVEILVLTEQKTGKTQRLGLNNTLRGLIRRYVGKKPRDSYLFPASRGVVGKPKHRESYHIALVRAARAIGYNEQISAHSLRKTFGRKFFEKTKDIRYLQQLFNHSHPSVTSRYLMLGEEEIQKMMQDFLIDINVC